MNDSIWVVTCFGITKDPETNNFMMVMQYAENGSLKKNLQNIVKDRWINKLLKLKDIISGLNTIHQKQLIHCDFHHGNILDQKHFMFISDLGLCKPVEYFQHSKKDDIYGVLPFVAPEVLRGKPYKIGRASCRERV